MSFKVFEDLSNGEAAPCLVCNHQLPVSRKQALPRGFRGARYYAIVQKNKLHPCAVATFNAVAGGSFDFQTHHLIRLCSRPGSMELEGRPVSCRMFYERVLCVPASPAAAAPPAPVADQTAETVAKVRSFENPTAAPPSEVAVRMSVRLAGKQALGGPLKVGPVTLLKPMLLAKHLGIKRITVGAADKELMLMSASRSSAVYQFRQLRESGVQFFIYICIMHSEPAHLLFEPNRAVLPPPLRPPCRAHHQAAGHY